MMAPKVMKMSATLNVENHGMQIIHGGVAATAHLDGPQWTGIFAHTAGDTPRLIYGSQFL